MDQCCPHVKIIIRRGRMKQPSDQQVCNDCYTGGTRCQATIHCHWRLACGLGIDLSTFVPFGVLGALHVCVRVVRVFRGIRIVRGVRSFRGVRGVFISIPTHDYIYIEMKPSIAY